MKRYYLMPKDGRKSFYNKAVVQINDDGSETLYSYETAIVTRTATTGRHIAAFCGLNKAGFIALDMKNQDKPRQAAEGRTLTNAESYQAMIARRLMG